MNLDALEAELREVRKQIARLAYATEATQHGPDYQERFQTCPSCSSTLVPAEADRCPACGELVDIGNGD